jgi:hypothetical protein
MHRNSAHFLKLWQIIIFTFELSSGKVVEKAVRLKRKSSDWQK